MKVFKYITIFLIVFTSCKSGKNVTDISGTRSSTAKKVIKKHIEQNFNKNTVDAKLKVHFKNEKQDVDFSVKMKIKKDEVIWLKGTKIITVFKAKITPEKVSFYSPYSKQYIEGDFKMLEKILGVAVNFQQLQNMLLGQAMFNTSEKHLMQPNEKSYKVLPKKQPDTFDIFYWINPTHFKLDQQAIANEVKNQRLDISYPSYKNTNTTLFPEKIIINGKAKNKQSDIEITVRSTIFNEEISIPFTIPTGYNEIKL